MTLRGRRGALLIAALVAVTLGSAWASPVLAGGGLLVVDNGGDDPAANACTVADDDCSLRGALSAATSGATIEIGVATVSLSGSAGALLVDKSLTIRPQSTDPDVVVTVDASGLSPSDRVFTVTGASAVIFERLLITGGDAVEGGGILVAPTDSPQFTLRNSTVTGNMSQFEGGGILNQGGITTIRESTITGNDAGASGAGVAAFGGGSTAILNSTVHANTSTDGVGGVFSGESAVALRHTTVTANSNLAFPSDVQNVAGPGLSLRNSIVAEPGGGTNCVFVDSDGGNVFDDNSCSADASETFGAVHLGPLTLENGGPTATRALTDASPAVDRAEPVTAAFAQGGTCDFPTDQRGQPRPALGGCDSGSYELQRASGGGGGTPPSADLAVDKSGPADVMVGDDIAYTIVVTNAGPNLAQGVELSDTLPAGVSFVSASPGCTEAGGTVTCALGAVAANATATVDVVVSTSAAGAVTNTATVDAVTADPDATDNSDDHLTDVVEVSRCAGLTRITTAIQCSVEVFDDGSADDVVLTRADLFPDAQAGTPLAVDLRAPLLLSEPEALNADTEEEILRVLAPGGTVHLLGGIDALSQAVEDRLAELDIATVRYPGANRFGTAVLIAEALGNPDVALVADGGDFPDSVIAGAAAVVAGAAFNQATPDIAAVLLSSGADLPPETAAYLADHEPTLVAVGGGAAEAVPDAAEVIVGADRFETSALVAERFFPSPSAAGVATGLVFADALVGGAIIGTPAVGPGPMLLTDPDTLPESVADYLAAHTDTLESVLLFGGTAAVSEDVEADIAAILAG